MFETEASQNEQATPDPSEGAASTYDSVAESVLESLESDTPGDGPSADAEPAVVDETTPEGDEGDGEQDGEGEPAEQTFEEEVAQALADLDRDSLTPELQALYDELQARQKGMLASFTKGKQQLSETERALQAKIEALEARLGEGTQQPAEQHQTAPDVRTRAWDGLGEPMTLEQALETSPEALDNYITARSREQIIEAMESYVAPQLQSLGMFVTASQHAAAQAELSRVTEAHPDLAAHPEGLNEAVTLMEAAARAGKPISLEVAAARAEAVLFSDQHKLKALVDGVKLGKQQQKVVETARKKVSTPASSASIAPKGIERGMSADDVVAALHAQIDAGE